MKKLFLFIGVLLFAACTPQQGLDVVEDVGKTVSENKVEVKNETKDYEGLHLDKIKLPEGFKIDVYVEDIKGARSMNLSPSGILFVGTRGAGKVYAVKDGEVHVVAKGLNNPNGVAFKDGDLYVAEINRVLRFSNIEENYDLNPGYEVITDDLPTEGHHGWKFIRFGPDGNLYVPVGAPCNVCLEENKVYASLLKMDHKTGDYDIIAEGIRNTVGFDWHPETKELWFTDNGRDWWGDDMPPDELNHMPKEGMHFGFPFCHANGLVDDSFGHGKNCDEYVSSAQDLGPHVAALGMRFYTGDMFPDEYKNQIFIAERGSWNRSTKIGYRVSLVRLENNKAVSYETFAEGWLQGQEPWGRPVDVLAMPDGSLLVSDDFSGTIYRIFYDT